MAARLHEFNRSTRDIVKIVKVHESTLRKRYTELSLFNTIKNIYLLPRATFNSLFSD